MPQAISIGESLPAVYRTKDNILTTPSHHIDKLLQSDLSVDDINCIEERLWAVGRPLPPRPLNIQGVLNRNIVPTTDPSLHLVWSPGRIFIKALPTYLLSGEFWDKHIAGQQPQEADALGLLYSYFALVPTELDFAIALERHLIPPNRIDWEEWKSLAASRLLTYSIKELYDRLPPRYLYGELRLSRLDSIYSYLGGSWMTGYSTLTSPQTYGEFITRHLVTIGTVTGYFFILLKSMQVGLSQSTHTLIQSTIFLRVCYGFATFTMLAPLSAAALVFLAFIIMFIYNWIRTLSRYKERYRKYDQPLRKGRKKRQAGNGPDGSPIELGQVRT